MASAEALITRQFLAIAERIASRLGDPRIRTLHLPPGEASGKDAEFCALELEDGSVGFSYILLGPTLPLLQQRGVAGLAGRSAFDVAQSYRRDHPVERALAFAAINALSQALFARAGWLPAEASDSVGQLAPAPGEKIGMIGLFGRLVPRIIEAGAELTVLELRPELAGKREGYRVTLDPADLAACDKIVSTSTILLNDTLDAVLAACRHASYLCIVGPTAGCVPDALFSRGVDVVGGTRVRDLARFRDSFLAGAPWSDHTSKYAITPESYPGVEALLERA
jgi:hypothetical protein